MSSVTLRLDGLDVVRRALLELPDRLATNSLASAVNAGGAIIRDEARALAPEWTGPVSEGHPPPGTLRRSIIVKSIRELSTYYRKVTYVTVRHGKKYQKQGKKGNLSQDAFYWAWVEFGHYFVPRGKQGYRSRRRLRAAVTSGSSLVAGSFFIPGQRFMQNAFVRKKGAAVDAIIAKLKERIEQHAAELKR